MEKRILVKFFSGVYLSVLLIFFLLSQYLFAPIQLQVNKNSFSILVSIMLPIFNKISYLNRSLNSAQNQSFFNLEIVCVDDCSTDHSSNFIIERMKKDFRIKFVQNFYNQGTCLTRINGIFSCEGDYIISLDPDDFLYLDAIELLYNSAIELNADILEYRIERRHPTRRILKNWYPCYQNYTGNEEILMKLQKFKYRLVGWGIIKKIIRRTIYQKAMKFLLPFVEGKKILNAEDLLHCGTIFLFMKNFVCTQILAYVYFIKNQGSATSGKSQSKIQSKVQSNYIEAVIRYFYKERKNPYVCNLKHLLANATVLNLYNNITNVDKIPIKNCNMNINEFFTFNYEANGYCVVMKKLLKKYSKY